MVGLFFLIKCKFNNVYTSTLLNFGTGNGDFIQESVTLLCYICVF